MLQIHQFACLTDNYAYLLHDKASGQTALVDAPEATPIQAALERVRNTGTVLNWKDRRLDLYELKEL